MTLRVVGPEDCPLLAEIHAEAFAAPWSAADLGALLQHPGAVALCADIDGFILLRRVLDEAEVLTIAVRPAARRGGLGRSLLDAATNLAAQGGAADLFLEVAEDNAAALALYRTAGFEAVGRRRAYYARMGGPAVDAIMMRRRLNTGPP